MCICKIYIICRKCCGDLVDSKVPNGTSFVAGFVLPEFVLPMHCMQTHDRSEL
jgi:hypothetical protein